MAEVNPVESAAETTPTIPQGVGLGISNGNGEGAGTPADDGETVRNGNDGKELPSPPPVIKVQTAEADIPPPPPPKPVESLQEVVLSRSSTPAAERENGHGPSTSVTSLHSTTSRPSHHLSRRSSTATTHSLASHHPTMSMSLSTSTSQSSPGPQLSSILITPPLQLLVASKEARKSPSFLAAAQRALDLCQTGDGANAAYLHPREIFEPLRLAISNPQTTSVPILITSLDLLAKLISHSFFSEPAGPPRGQSPLPDLITHTITLSYSENSPPQVALQVVKALMAIVLSTDKGMLVHQSSLLKAIRTVYNVFLLSTDGANQVVAQGGLTQMVHHVFGRVVRPDTRSAGTRTRGSTVGENEARRLEQEEIESAGRAATPVIEASGKGKLTLDSFAEPNPNDSIPAGAPPITDTDGASAGHPPLPTATISIPVPNGDALDTPEPAYPETMPTNGPPGGADETEGNLDSMGRPIPTEELFVKDAFLVFRALCKLSMKPLVTESERDLRSHAMRSKLLSLHLVLTILKSHAEMFVNPLITIPSNSSLEMTPFLQATKQYLCLSLSRNAVSPVNQVFELSVEIFWCVLKSMRAQMKKEIEVLLNEIFIPILEMRHSTIRQKSLILGIFIRLCQDPQALVEIYINYDCDRAALENIYERLMNIVSKIGQTHFAPPSKEELAAGSSSSKQGLGSGGGPAIPPSLATSAISNEPAHYAGLPPEIKLRRQSLECLVAALKSLVSWSSARPTDDQQQPPRHSEDGVGRHSTSGSTHELAMPTPHLGWPTGASSGANTPDIADDEVGRFESAKQRKNTLLEGIKKFNFKPKRGVQYLIENGFIKSKAPQDVARFLMGNDGLSKAMIGEYLGEADEENVATMHAFVDMLDFTNISFTEAVRLYLQSFRLPGEAQKIDRFVLKFAERYMEGNPATIFANADTAYILAFSVILLNTDAHNKNMKQKRMTKAEFVRNNRGINDGKDLPEDFLFGIYDEIQGNEIKMKDEIQEVGAAPGGLAAIGRDLQREAYVTQTENMASKTEALFKTMVRQQKRGVVRATDHFYAASRLEHVRFMFEVAWMPFLAGISAPLQETDDIDVVNLCLEGLRSAIRIVCLFDMELERNAFVTTLAKFTFLNNLGEMKPKNVEAIKSLLEIALTDGNNLKASWKDVLTCVSQLERMQLISSGMDVPDLNRRESINGKKKKGPADEVAEESRSREVTVAADMVFSMSNHLSGSAIVDFVQALSEVSWEEIQSSGASARPRMFSLQKLVEISYYNMGRIRLEWSGIWMILGEHFNQVCCHNNPNVSFFALDALRQLAMNFLEKEELSHFRFQKDFLKPFEYTIVHNMNSDAREMVLQCLQQMLQARVQNLRSGWRTIFSVFSAASKVLTERVANYAFELVTLVYREHFSLVVKYGSFADLTICITDFCKVSKFQKISLQAIEMVRGLVGKMLQCPECLLPGDGAGAANDEPMVKYWLPVLHSFLEIIMTGEDLEVRRLALDCLFETLKTHGKGFSAPFWRTVTREVLFPIFAILKAKSDVRFKSPEDMSVWLSTTLISALRDLINLYTYYFDILQNDLDGLLDILVACICQENDTLARIGTSCFQQLLESNVRKLSPAKWESIVSAFVQLFKTTTAFQLFDPVLHAEVQPTDNLGDEGDAPFHKFVAPAPLEPVLDSRPALPPTLTYSNQRRIFKQIIVKCVLQLLLIETTHELLQNDDVYNTIPAEHLLRFMGVLDDSWRFARKFNADKDLRMKLWKVGFMKQLPNLLKQESSSAATLINVLLRMYKDPREAHRATRSGVLDRLVPLGTEVIRDFIAIDAESQPRNVAAWTPVVSEILRGGCDFEEEAFESFIPTLYPLVTALLNREVAPEMRLVIRDYFERPVHATGRYFRHTVLEILKSDHGIHAYAVNRLDRLTSGLMIMALTSAASRDLAEEFASGGVKKEYVARVRGKFPEEEIEVDQPLLTVDRQMGLVIVTPEGKEARTIFKRMSYDEKRNQSVVHCRPMTGRTHQLRVHLQYLGYPIANDPLYSGENIWGNKLGKGGVELVAPAPDDDSKGKPKTNPFESRIPKPAPNDADRMAGNEAPPTGGTLRRTEAEEKEERDRENIDLTSPILLSAQARNIIAKLRKQKDEQEDWVKWKEVVFKVKAAQDDLESATTPSVQRKHPKNIFQSQKAVLPDPLPEDTISPLERPEYLPTEGFCEECFVPLPDDPDAETLFIYLHAMRYTTEKLGMWETPLPRWAGENWDGDWRGWAD
ncbi:brefeldin A-inhibited guanine nucleotide-exchange protein, partial [Tremellales sp. Uapishka_1]